MGVRMTLPPGPKGHPVIGSLLAYRADPLAFFDSLRDYGSVTRLRIMGHEFCVLSHPDPIEEVLVTKARSFRKSKDYREGLAFLGNGLLNSEGDFWLRQRRLEQPAFHRARIGAYGETMVAYAERLLETWRDGEERDVHKDMMRVTLEIVTKTLFDVDITRGSTVAGAEEVEEAMDLFMVDTIADGNLLKSLLPQKLVERFDRPFQEAVVTMDGLVYGMIHARRREGGDRGDLMSMLISATDADTGERMSDAQLRDELMTLLTAGHETTANALAWTWVLLAENPEAEARLGAELDEVLGGRPPTLSDLPNLRYTEWVIKESMRLLPPVWSVGREALSDCTIGGYTIPKGMQVSPFQWLTHRDGRFFEDPLVFKPERWADGLEKRLPRYAYFPFGGGPRMCIGSSFASMEAVLVLATLAQRFKLRLTHPEEVVPAPTITLRPKHGVKVRLEARVPAPKAVA